MKRYRYNCSLQEPLILFKKEKTEQTIEALDYIPGNTFRGIVAASLFKEQIEASQEEVHKQLINQIIFKDKVIFGDAHLVVKDKALEKVPLSLYKHKTDENCYHHFHHNIDFGKKWKQVREGYLLAKENDTYKLVNVQFGDRIKASRNASNRSADDGGLFFYRFIEKRQTFQFEIKSEDHVLLEKVKEILDNSIQLLGKAKGAEFGGRAQIKFIDEKKVKPTETKGKYLYAKSNLCFLNSYGSFTVTPNVNEFTTDETVKIDWHKSQIRYRKFMPYNGHRNNWDAERLIIEKGSVIVFDNEVTFKTDGLKKGFGCFLSEGYGQVEIDPPYVKNDKNIIEPKKTEKEKTQEKEKTHLVQTENFNAFIDGFKADKEKKETYPTQKEKLKAFTDGLETNKDGLTAFLIKQYEYKQAQINIHNTANDCCDAFSSQVTASQWSRLYEASRQAKNTEDLKTKLFNKENGICTPGTKKLWKDNDINKLKSFLNNKEYQQNMPEVFSIFVKKMQLFTSENKAQS